MFQEIFSLSNNFNETFSKIFTNFYSYLIDVIATMVIHVKYYSISSKLSMCVHYTFFRLQ